MMNNNKILTVSYGTFSCTLEGFDDSFGTMKAIAEYFRDLAADDRYFGAEPAQPDAQMLAHIAQNEIARRVEAREQDGKIVLSAQQEAASTPIAPAAAAGVAGLASSAAALETKAAPAPTSTSAPAEPAVSDYEEEEDFASAPARATAVDIVPSVPDEEVEAFFEGTGSPDSINDGDLAYADTGAPTSSIADRLSRIRAVVSQQTDDEAEMPADYVEDQHAGTEPEAELEDMPDVADAVAADEEDSDALADAMTDIEAALEADDEVEARTDEDGIDEDALDLALTDDAPFDEDTAEPDTMEDDVVGDDLSALLGRLDASEAQETAEAEAEAAEASHATKIPSDDLNLHAITEEDSAEEETADDLSESDAFLDLMAEDSDEDEPFEDEEAAGDDDHATLADFLADAEDDAADDEADDVVEDESAARETAEDEKSEPFVLTDAVKSEDADEDVLALLSTVTDEGEGAEIEGADENLFDEASDAVADGPRARVLKVKRADLEAAIERGNLEEIEEDADDLDVQSRSSLSAEDEADLARELAELETELGGNDDTLRVDHDDAEQEAEILSDFGEDDAEDTPLSGRSKLADIDEDSSDLSRLMEVTEDQMGEPESATRRDAFAHLKAAVAAKKADDASGADTTDAGSEDEAYRADLADAVRPRRPTIVKTSRTERPDDARPAPLKLVAEQRIDLDASAAAGPVRPRRVAALAEAAAGEEDGSFADFAQEVGASELPDLLEAAAAYMSFVEGREQFSRPQLMTKVRQVEKQDFSREEGLRSFGKLLRDGKIQKIRGGRFQASEDIGFKPDTRAAS